MKLLSVVGFFVAGDIAPATPKSVNVGVMKPKYWIVRRIRDRPHIGDRTAYRRDCAMDIPVDVILNARLIPRKIRLSQILIDIGRVGRQAWRSLPPCGIATRFVKWISAGRRGRILVRWLGELGRHGDLLRVSIVPVRQA